ncbi:MAG: hypothetical protein KAW41_01370 [Candidatus Diapherotrites archaeon]|nr:hypothetical protein [Candidatus Diapherotrites archaeon]
MRGQVFTIDLFTAYTVFMIVMLVITLMALWVGSAIQAKEKVDSMSLRAIAGLDYLCYGDNFTEEPYKLEKGPVDWFFSQSNAEVRDTLRPGWNYSLKLNMLNGTTMLSAGGELAKADTVVSFERLVYYNNTRSKLLMSIWEER